MNKIIIIGDIHGRTIWEQIISKESDLDLVIFLGDYFDSSGFVLPIDEYANFMKIVKYKDDNPDKVVLLIGNHDLHYIDNTQQCSGYSTEIKRLLGNFISSLIEDNTLQASKFLASILFVHAGISNTWLKDNGLKLDETQINNYLKTNPEQFDFQSKNGFADASGNDIFQSPLWIRPESLLKDSVDDVIQIVGHTRTNPTGNIALANINFCDSLEWGKYYAFEKDSNWKFKMKQL